MEKQSQNCSPKVIIILSLIFLLISASYLNAEKQTAVILYDTENASCNFAASEMKIDLEMAGFDVNLSDIKKISTIKSDIRIILTDRLTQISNSVMNAKGISPLPPSSPESYSIRKIVNNNSTDWYIIGSDIPGTMYGGIDVARSIKLYGIENLKESDRKPYIKERGIKFNIPLDARTPSYSDNSDAAQRNIEVVWDKNFWYGLLDRMAKDHLNMLSIWSLAPFPSLVNVPEYPKAGLDDVKKTTAPLSVFKSLNGDKISSPEVLKNLITIKSISLNQKIEFWKEIMQYASTRGVSFYIFTWNIFPYGTEDSGYGFTDNVNDTKTKDFFRKATKALILTYPLLKGVGITAGENMIGTTSNSEKEKFLYEAYGEGINDALTYDPQRIFRLIHRAHQSDIQVIKNAFSGLNSRCEMNFSYKYSQAHVYSSTKPDYIIKDKFLTSVGNSKFYLTVRDDDWYYLRGGSDPDFTRTYLKNMPSENFNGFYLGPDGIIWGKESAALKQESNEQTIYEKRWYSFHIWGTLAYDPEVPNSYFVNTLKSRFKGINSEDLFEAWSSASQVIPLINRFHNSGCQLDFQWYPEACFSNSGFHSIDRFINTDPQSGEGIIGIKEYYNSLAGNSKITGITPPEIAEKLKKVSDNALEHLTGIKGQDPELIQTVEDIKAMAELGYYYSNKIVGATNKYLASKATDQQKKNSYINEAVRNLERASENWKKYSQIIGSHYKPQYLNRMQGIVDISAIQSEVEKDLEIAKNNINP
jgi:hypothetical protein